MKIDNKESIMNLNRFVKNKTNKSDSKFLESLDSIKKLDSNEGQNIESNKSDLDKNAFLHLLTTQLANQDPLNPIEDREFISQLAQFSSLEQMNNLNEKTENLVEAVDFLTLQYIDGNVIVANEIYKIKRGLEEYLGIKFDDLIEEDIKDSDKLKEDIKIEDKIEKDMDLKLEGRINSYRINKS